MTRIDWIILRRLSGRIAVMLVLIFGVILLAESLNVGRVRYLAEVGGAGLAAASMLAAAARWTLRTLSVIVLVGAILGILDLQVRQEFNVIKASGRSIWSAMRAPLAATIIAGLGVSLFLDSEVTRWDRALNPTQAGDQGAVSSDGALWLEQVGNGQRYVMRAERVQPGATVVNDVTFFLESDFEFDRIFAPQVQLGTGEWQIVTGTAFSLAALPVQIADYRIPTESTRAELALRLSSTQDMTIFELAGALAGQLGDPSLRDAVATRFLRLLALPLLLAGSVLIAFAFTSGYRRSNKYGAAVLYGIVLGFVVFFVTELADRAGSAGALDPMFAAVGPAFVAVVVGVTVLLYREDGRA